MSRLLIWGLLISFSSAYAAETPAGCTLNSTQLLATTAAGTPEASALNFQQMKAAMDDVTFNFSPPHQVLIKQGLACAHMSMNLCKVCRSDTTDRSKVVTISEPFHATGAFTAADAQCRKKYDIDPNTPFNSISGDAPGTIFGYQVQSDPFSPKQTSYNDCMSQQIQFTNGSYTVDCANGHGNVITDYTNLEILARSFDLQVPCQNAKTQTPAETSASPGEPAGAAPAVN